MRLNSAPTARSCSTRIRCSRPSQRLAVYRNNARVTFEKTLVATFPVLGRLVGEPCFRVLALRFMREFPSRSGDLGRYGAELPELLDVCYRDTRFAYLADVARLEWACARAETAADAMPLDPARLADVDEASYAQLCFDLQPAAQFVSSRFPVLTIWRANQAEHVECVDLGRGAEHVLVLHGSNGAVLHGLDAGTFAFAASLAQGESLGDAHDAGAALDRAFDPGEALGRLAAIGALGDFHLPSDATIQTSRSLP